MSRWYLILGAANGFLAVAAGAFAAHGLRGQLDEQALHAFHTGADYQGLHALALLALGLWHRQASSRWLDLAGACLIGGILLFSGSLYALSLSGIRGLGMITPFGGLLLLAGWFSLTLAAWRLAPSQRG